MEKLGGVPPGVPPPPKPPGLLTDQETRAQQPLRRSRTGQLYQTTPQGTFPVLDAPVSGVRHIAEGVEQTAEPGLQQKALGGSKIIGGLGEVATPLAVVGGVTAPIGTAATMVGAAVAQKGASAAASAAGASPEVSEFVGNVAGLLAGAGGAGYLIRRAYVAAGSPEVKFGGTFEEPKAFRDMTDEELVAQANAIEQNPPKNYRWQKEQIVQEAARRQAERGMAGASPAPPESATAAAPSPAAPSPATPAPTAAAATVPEAPGTMQAQVEQLRSGARRAVMFPKGTALTRRPKGMKVYQDSFGNTFYYNPALANVQSIDQAVAQNRLNELLGATDGGTGAPDKTQLDDSTTVAVTAKDASGETVQSTVTDQAHLPETIAQTQKLTPEGGSVEVEPPEHEIAHRLSAANGGEEITRGTSEIPVTPEGREQEAEAAEKLEGIDKVFAGPLARTQEMGQAIADANGAPMETVPGLRPWALGELEGQPHADTKDTVERLMKEAPDVAPPGQGPLSQYPGESHNQFIRNFTGAMQPILADWMRNPEQRFAVVSHSRDARVLRAWVESGMPADPNGIDKNLLDAPVPEPGQFVRLYRPVQWMRPAWPPGMPMTPAPAGPWKIEPATDSSQPGIYLVRHGETEWNQGGAIGEAQPPAHEFSSTQVQLPPDVANPLMQYGDQIPDQDLAGDGRESEPHITVKYGLHGADPDAVAELLRSEPPITATLGRASLFRNDDAHVLKVDVDSTDLHRLNAKIAQLPNGDKHPDYQPHATIAYLKPDAAISGRYDRAAIPGVTGRTVRIGSVVFSGKDGRRVEIPLGGAPDAGTAATRSRDLAAGSGGPISTRPQAPEVAAGPAGAPPAPLNIAGNPPPLPAAQAPAEVGPARRGEMAPPRPPAEVAREPVVLQDFVAGRGGFASPARMVVRSLRPVGAEEIRQAFFPDMGPDQLQIEKLRADDFMSAVEPGRQPFRLQFLKNGRHVEAPPGIETRLGLRAGENYHGPVPAEPQRPAAPALPPGATPPPPRPQFSGGAAPPAQEAPRLAAQLGPARPAGTIAAGALEDAPPRSTEPIPAEAPAAARAAPPSLGQTGREIYQAWRALAEGPQPPRASIEGYVPGLGRFGMRGGKIQVLHSTHMGRGRGYASTSRDATASEIQALHDAIDRGQFQVEQRTVRGALGVREHADAGALEKVLHQATGRPLPEFLGTDEGKEWARRTHYEDVMRSADPAAAKLRPAENRGLFEEEGPEQGSLFSASVAPRMAVRDQVYYTGAGLGWHAAQARLEAIPLDPQEAPYAHAYLANPSGIELLGRIGSPGLPADYAALHYGGITVAPQDTWTLLARIDREMERGGRPGLRQLREATEGAARAGKSLVLVKDHAQMPDAMRQVSLDEEIGHAIQASASGGDLNAHIEGSQATFFEDGDARAAARALAGRGYGDVSAGQMAAEIGVRLMAPGRFAELSLQYGQARRLAALYLRTLRKEYGRVPETREIAGRIQTAFRRGDRPGGGEYPSRAGGAGPAGRGGPSGGTGSLISGNAGELAGLPESSARGATPQPRAGGTPPGAAPDRPVRSAESAPVGRAGERGFVNASILTTPLTAAGKALGVPEFIEQDLIPTLKGAKEGAKTLVKGLVETILPKVGVSSKALDSIYKLKGDRDKEEFLFRAAAQQFADSVGAKADPAVVAQVAAARPDLKAKGLTPLQAFQVDFMDRIKTGQRQLTPELQNTADFLRQADDGLYKAQTQYRNVAWLENHQRVMWKTIPGSKTDSFKGVGQRPLQGSKGQFKRHVFQNMSEGIELGGVPFDYNPVENFTRHYVDVMKFLTAQKWWEEARKMKARVFVRFGSKPPDGFVKLDDGIARTFFSVPQGMVNAGEWYVERGMARLMNNYLSRDRLREQDTALGTLGQAVMAAKNGYTAVELGFSGFHAVFETMESGGSSIGLGLRKAVNLGDVAGALKDIAKGLGVAPAARENWRLGKSGEEYLRDPAAFAQTSEGQALLKAYPDARQLMEDLFQGGGRLDVYNDYKQHTIRAFREAVGQRNYLGAGVRSLGAAAEAVMVPLFEWYIPRVKVGVFLKEYSTELLERQAEIASGKVSRAQVAREVWDFVEDRFGEMNFDNLFWNRTFKTAMQILMRSVTWKAGSVRAGVKAPGNQVRELWNAAQERRRPRLTREFSWLLGMAGLTAAIGTVITFAFAHQWPHELKDVFYPRTDANDPNQRVAPPTYVKEYDAMRRHPLRWAAGGVSGTLERTIEVLQNQDYFHQKIWNDDDSEAQKALKIVLNYAPRPIAWQSFQRMQQEGAGAARAAASFAGFPKAPRYVTETPAEELISRYQDEARPAGGWTSDERSRIKNRVTGLLRAKRDAEATQVALEGLRGGKVTLEDMRQAAARAEVGRLAADFERLPLAQAIQVAAVATPEEKQQILPELGKKLDRQFDNLPAVEQQKLLREMRQLHLIQ
jgi:broad specificity phosphatase PhoE/2'-5' RNA ligase